MQTCYYDNPFCQGEQLWQCQTCREWFCQFHGHYTTQGQNVECVACERARVEAALDDAQAQTVTQIGRIEAALADLGRALEQVKADLGCADWTTAGELGHIAQQLEQVRAFWYQNGPEYESA